MNTTTHSIELVDVVKTFSTRGGQPVRAVDGLNLTVSPGEVVAFLGPNGAGKTTTLDMVMGLTAPDSGQVKVVGGSPRQAILDGRVSAVLQSGGLLRDLTVQETVKIIASTFPDHRPVAEVIDRADLAEIANRRVSKCSGGEQQRLRFALALLPDPDLLILDEPTTGMDVGVRRSFWDSMKADAARGRTVVFATHYLHEAEMFAERIVMVSHGRIVADGSMSEIRSQYAERTISADVPRPADGAQQSVQDWLTAIRVLPGVRDVAADGRRVRVRAEDTDTTALALLRDLGARNLEISGVDLEAAFMALTGEGLTPAEPADPSATEQHARQEA